MVLAIPLRKSMRDAILDTSINFAELISQGETRESSRDPIMDDNRSVVAADLRAYHLGIWLSAIRSFFNIRNHPLTETERAEILQRDFTNEAHIAQQALLRCSQLTLELLHPETPAPFDKDGATGAPDFNLIAERNTSNDSDVTDHTLGVLAEVLDDAQAICDVLLKTRTVSFRAWMSIGRSLMRGLEHSEACRQLVRAARHRAAAHLQPELLTLTERIKPDALGRAMLVIFSDLARLIELLRFVEDLLRRDYPLKQSLPIFTLVHEETRLLLDFIETRALRIEEMDGAIFDALDGTSYAIGMELCRIFPHELAGFGALRQASPVFIKVDSASGLLLNCFQQSTIVLAQTFDPSLDGARLFNAFQVRLEQSLLLRDEVWKLLQLVRRTERSRNLEPVIPFLNRLVAFRSGSMRYLFYKDWESYERFIEEIAAARNSVELAPVLHRLDTFLETLLSQINMRTVLANYPFDYPAVEE